MLKKLIRFILRPFLENQIFKADLSKVQEDGTSKAFYFEEYPFGIKVVHYYLFENYPALVRTKHVVLYVGFKKIVDLVKEYTK